MWEQKDSWIFKKPVDTKKLGLKDYFKIITQPMDLGCVKNRLENMFYWQVIIFKQTLILRKALNFKVSVHHQAALHRRNMIDTHSVLKVGLRRVEGYIGTYF